MEAKTDRQVISFPRIPVTLVQGVVKSNKADKYLKETITEILEEGQWDKEPRTRWADGTPAHSKFVTQKVYQYDISKGETIAPSSTQQYKQDLLITIATVLGFKGSIALGILATGASLFYTIKTSRLSNKQLMKKPLQYIVSIRLDSIK